ncbi:alpha/beta hydrolase [Abyssalbus ytuae]|uniref:Alpha/beta hydrolase-fold protein n=1 Tax=Abyssalbus ytuae TaxID=2926907 RepID=A0A9E7CSD1_9FLAO|nr:alpha/beta hydrolase-fold protein [Abyssalbus ytuae]UOB16091.1 alpha/beta hydrolase-fold protein [Abyssalbus ytuae]
MKPGKIVCILFLFFISGIKAQDKQNENPSTPFSIGEITGFYSNILKEERTVNIFLPSSYKSDPYKTYPVIYLLDGSADEDFIHISGVVQFASFSWINILPETIVVGIANIDRKRDFTYPTHNKKDKEDFPTTGGSKDFINFLEKELQPFIKKNYRTSNTKTIIGQSLGGLLATEILFKKPDLFDNYIIISPSLWWDDESLLKLDPQPYFSQKSVYIGVGKEGEIMERTARELYNKLKSESRENAQLFFNYFEQQNHGDALHLAVYDGFEKIFKTQKSKM